MYEKVNDKDSTMDLLSGECTSGIVTLILILLTFTLIYYYCNYKVTYWIRRGVPQLKTTSKIFGDFKNAVMFRCPPGYYLGNIYREAPADAPFVGFYIFHKPCILLKDIELIKNVLVRDFNNFSDRYFAGSPQKDSFGMINLFGLKTLPWRYVRRKITPSFSKEKLKQMFPLMMETSQPLRRYLREHVDPEDKTALDIQEMNYKFSADLIGTVALGAQTDSFKNPDSGFCKFFMSFFASFERMVALISVFFMPQLIKWFGSIFLFNASYIRKVFWKSVEFRERSGQQRGDFIDYLLQLKKGVQDPIYKFEGENLLYQSGQYFSGFESSAIAGTFTLMHLARNKEYQQLAREDIKRSIEKHGWTLEAFNAMKYLDKCVLEGIRLNPAVPMLDRYTLEDYTFPNTDVVIPKGTPIYMSMTGLHGDPKYFEDPDVFKPDRFNDDRNISPAYIPFGDGPRKCLGTKIGELHAKLIITMVLSEFEVHQELTQENKLDPRSTFTAAARGITLEFTKLKN